MKPALAATLLFAILSALPAHADGDAVAGKDVFKKCAICHVANEPKNKVGPTLYGVVGRPAGSVADFRYSPNMVELGQGGLVWSEDRMAAYLRKPKDVVPKGTMAFMGLQKDDEIANVIAYLKADPKP